jgi:hypothetical protein
VTLERALAMDKPEGFIPHFEFALLWHNNTLLREIRAILSAAH